MGLNVTDPEAQLGSGKQHSSGTRPGPQTHYGPSKPLYLHPRNAGSYECPLSLLFDTGFHFHLHERPAFIHNFITRNFQNARGLMMSCADISQGKSLTHYQPPHLQGPSATETDAPGRIASKGQNTKRKKSRDEEEGSRVLGNQGVISRRNSGPTCNRRRKQLRS